MGAVTQGLRIAFGRGVCGSLDEAAPREWLVTDGLGGYACGTVAGLRTRRYHGLLVARDRTGGRLADARAGRARRRRGDRRPADPAGHPRVGRRCGRPARARAPRRLRPRRRGAPLALRPRRGAARGRGGDGARRRRRRRRAPPAGGRGPPRGDPAVHLARPARRAVRRGGPAGGADRVGLRLRVRLPGGRPGLPARRRVVPRRPPPRGGGPGARRDRGPLGRRHVPRRPRTPGEALEVSATTELGVPRPGRRADRRRRPRPGRRTLAARSGAGTTTSTGSWPWPPTGSSSRPRADPRRWPATRGSASGPATCSPPTRDCSCAPAGPTRAARCWPGRPAPSPQGMLANTADVGTLEYNTIDATLWFLHALGRHVAHTGDLDLAAELSDTVVDDPDGAPRRHPLRHRRRPRHRAAARRRRRAGR